MPSTLKKVGKIEAEAEEARTKTFLLNSSAHARPHVSLILWVTEYLIMAHRQQTLCVFSQSVEKWKLVSF